MRYGCLVSFTDANWDRLYSRLRASAQHARAALADADQVAASGKLCNHGGAAIELWRCAVAAKHQSRDQPADSGAGRVLGVPAAGCATRNGEAKTPLAAFFCVQA